MKIEGKLQQTSANVQKTDIRIQNVDFKLQHKTKPNSYPKTFKVSPGGVKWKEYIPN